MHFRIWDLTNPANHNPCFLLSKYHVDEQWLSGHHWLTPLVVMLLCRQGPSTLAVCLACVLLWPLEHEKAWCKQLYKHWYTEVCSYGMLLGSLSLLESGPANLLQLLHGHSQPTDVPAEIRDVNEEAIFNAPTITLIKKTKPNPCRRAMSNNKLLFCATDFLCSCFAALSILAIFKVYFKLKCNNAIIIFTVPVHFSQMDSGLHFGYEQKGLNSVNLRKLFVLSQVQFFHLSSRNKAYS